MAATPPAPWWIYPALTAVAFLVLAGYAGSCWIWPFTNCSKCDGTARIKSPSGKAFRRCRKCKATGRQLRLGRRVYNFVNRIKREGE